MKQKSWEIYIVTFDKLYVGSLTGFSSQDIRTIDFLNGGSMIKDQHTTDNFLRINNTSIQTRRGCEVSGNIRTRYVNKSQIIFAFDILPKMGDDKKRAIVERNETCVEFTTITTMNGFLKIGGRVIDLKTKMENDDTFIPVFATYVIGMKPIGKRKGEDMFSQIAFVALNKAWIESYVITNGQKSPTCGSSS
jgi:hypothetical protein